MSVGARCTFENRGTFLGALSIPPPFLWEGTASSWKYLFSPHWTKAPELRLAGSRVRWKWGVEGLVDIRRKFPSV